MKTTAKIAAIAAVVLAALTAPAPAQTAGDLSYGEWTYIDNSDPVTQARTDFAMYGSATEDAAIAVKCFSDGEANVVYAVLDVGDKMTMVTGDDHAFLSYRIGDQLRGTNERWPYSQSDDMAMAADLESDRIVDAILAASDDATMGVRIYNSDGESVSVIESPIRSAKRAVGRLSCVR